jgi:1-deoxy-D-xylulose-5-phosphate reductoisomerase
LSPPDLERFPAVRLGYDVAARGGTAGVVLNAVNEEAVQAFLNGVVKFQQIAELCERAVSEHPFIDDPTLEDILRLDAWARKEVQTWMC